MKSPAPRTPTASRFDSVKSLIGRAVLCFAIASPLAVVGLTGEADAGDRDIDRFAKCITTSGATFYGAHWCGYCRKQKQMFGASASRLPYVECYAPGSRNNKLAKCKDIRGFPSWSFGNGKARGGMLSFEALANATGCRLP